MPKRRLVIEFDDNEPNPFDSHDMNRFDDSINGWLDAYRIHRYKITYQENQGDWVDLETLEHN